MPSPLRVGKAVDDGPESPEALLISALIDSGEYTPEQYGVTPEYFSCWQKLDTFGREYQQRSGLAPPLALVRSKFPDFEFKEGLSPAWAAGELHKAHGSRQLRLQLREAVEFIEKDDLDGAYSVLEALHRPKIVRRKPADGFDLSDVEEFDVARIPVAANSLGRATGGIGPGEMWLYAARPGTGKTYGLAEQTAVSVKHGYNVTILSLEMSVAKIKRRVLRCMATKAEREVLDKAFLDKDWRTLKMTGESIRERLSPAQYNVVDPSHGIINPAVIRSYMTDCDLLILDHIGLVTTNGGNRAVEDWRHQATISNQLKQECLSSGVPLLAAAQINRQGDTASRRPPKISQLTGSDALGQDSDVIVTMARQTKHVMLSSAEKVRDGESLVWYSHYDPVHCNFAEMTKDRAIDVMATDEEFREND